MAEKQDYDEIHPSYGVPKEMVSCPGCGKVYKGMVCLSCEECKTCCKKLGLCKDPNYLAAGRVKEHIAKHGEFPEPQDV